MQLHIWSPQSQYVGPKVFLYLFSFRGESSLQLHVSDALKLMLYLLPATTPFLLSFFEELCEHTKSILFISNFQNFDLLHQFCTFLFSSKLQPSDVFVFFLASKANSFW